MTVPVVIVALAATIRVAIIKCFFLYRREVLVISKIKRVSGFVIAAVLTGKAQFSVGGSWVSGLRVLRLAG